MSINIVKLAWQDYHTFTWMFNKKFRKFMFRKYFILWYFWKKKTKREYAKIWNHAKAYDARDLDVRIKIDE